MKKNQYLTNPQLKTFIMGKGDKKTKRGKIVNRSYGVRRPKNKNKTTTITEKPSPAKKTSKTKKA